MGSERANGIHRLVVAASPDLVGPGERSFVERLEMPMANMTTYSAVLSAHDCRGIDEAAYVDSRSWYRTPAGEDRSVHNGVSLGRAFEYVATLELIRVSRARTVLERLNSDAPVQRVILRSVTREWAIAARQLGLDVHVDGSLGSGPMPGTRSLTPRRYHRYAALALSMFARTPSLALVDTRAWAVAYGAALSDRWALESIDPGPRFVLGMLRGRHPMKSRWLADAHEHGPKAGPIEMPSTSTRLAFLSDIFRGYVAGLTDAGSFGMERAGHYRLAVACQDVLPPVRAFLLGFRAGGGRVVTLEHGISGVYADQVRSVSDVLGVWGEPQRTYHSALLAPDQDVLVLGWPPLEGVVPQIDDTARWDVVFFSQPPLDLTSGGWPEDAIGAIRRVQEYAKQHPHRRVAIKQHPSTASFGWWGPETTGNVKVIHGNSFDVLKRTRVAIVERSTTGIEAMALGVPVVQLGRAEVVYGPDFIARSGAPRPATVDELTDAVEGLLTNSAERSRSRDRGRAYAESFVASLDDSGAGARRLGEVVSRLHRSG